MSSLLGLGTSYKNNAMSGFRQLSTLEENRERANANIDFQNKEMKKQETTSAIGSTVTGAAMGAQVAGPWGAAAGAVLGFASSVLF
jgi:hypothetical protein